MKVIIVGGGIGGLATALMCHARGIDCEVYEQAEQIRAEGEPGGQLVVTEVDIAAPAKA
jgi:2-polyprenyl-6-methoxyphenol hydroxylase-like FAD-dependent oxidoreductase